MYLYVELWKTQSKWHNLSRQERAEFISEAGQYIQPIITSVGVEFFSSFNDSDISHRADYNYINVWKIPNKELIQKLEKAIDQTDWHQYFEQVNAGGEAISIETQLGKAIST